VGVLQAIVLGAVQGITEFLPISSDGHLALAYAFMRLRPSLAFEVFLHGATLLAMLVYFRSDISRLVASIVPPWGPDRAGDRRLVGLLLAGTVVSGAVALSIAPVVEPMAADLRWVGVWFLGTAALLALAESLHARVSRLDGPEGMSWPKLAMVALFQGAAVLPGLSRSGSTIAGGMFAGLDRSQAARFSFLLGIPIIALASAKDALDLLSGAHTLPGASASVAGFATAGVAGYLSIRGLLAVVKRAPLYVFAAYTAVLGVILLGFPHIG